MNPTASPPLRSPSPAHPAQSPHALALARTAGSTAAAAGVGASVFAGLLAGLEVLGLAPSGPAAPADAGTPAEDGATAASAADDDGAAAAACGGHWAALLGAPMPQPWPLPAAIAQGGAEGGPLKADPAADAALSGVVAADAGDLAAAARAGAHADLGEALAPPQGTSASAAAITERHGEGMAAALADPASLAEAARRSAAAAPGQRQGSDLARAATERLASAGAAVEGAGADAAARPVDTAAAGAAVAPTAPPMGMAAAWGLTPPAAGGAVPAATQAVAQPFELMLSTPVDHEDFALTLGLQVSALVREGVHEARVQLNPADLGPITIEITLDGREAQVHFAADHAQSRDALRDGLPTLERALQADGFTLAGGSVGDGRSGGAGEGRARQAADGAARALRVPAPAGAQGDDVQARRAIQAAAAAARGAVDLYA